MTGVQTCALPIYGDKLYGSVTTANIGDAMEAAGVDIDRRKILLTDSIRNLGEYEIDIRLHPDVRGKLKLSVVRQGGPIEEIVEETKAVEESVTNDAESENAEEAKA